MNLSGSVVKELLKIIRYQWPSKGTSYFTPDSTFKKTKEIEDAEEEDEEEDIYMFASTSCQIYQWNVDASNYSSKKMEQVLNLSTLCERLFVFVHRTVVC